MVHLLVKEMISPYDVVRKQAREALTILSTITSKSVKDITAPFRDILNETVSISESPKKRKNGEESRKLPYSVLEERSTKQSADFVPARSKC